ncbi:hypothetical protein B0O80DRAFT_431939 [Mortierella sp. GBAus27b]|nr:hypothetical protein B0O80DRAFT_431939 [Mortierella sp. GBAus27b]
MCVRGIELPSKDDLISGAFQGKEGRTNKQGSNAPLPCFSEAGIQHLVCYEQAGEPLDPFDEYVNIDRIVEGRASEGDTASVKVPLTKSKRKRSGRSKCKENDDGEDFDTSDDDDPSHDDFTGDPGPSTKLSKLKNIQRHSHQIRGQGRQTNRNPSSSQLTSKSQRAPSIRKNPTRGASKKHAVQGQNGGYVLPFSGYQISGPANNERDYANGGGTQTNISIPQSSHYQPELEVNGVRTTDGQWHLLPNVPAPLHCDTSGYYPSQHDIAVRPDQPCGSNPLAPPEYSVVKMEDCINTESHGVKRRQDFEQSPHRDQGSYLQEVNDATTQQGGKEKRRRLGQHEIDQPRSPWEQEPWKTSWQEKRTSSVAKRNVEP